MGKISLSDMECLTLEKAEKKQLVEKCVWQNRNQPVRKLRIQPVGKE